MVPSLPETEIVIFANEIPQKSCGYASKRQRSIPDV